MKWVKRGCWVAAWGVWVWLGVGLWRELPRDLGSPTCRLPLDKSEIIVGLLDDPVAAVSVAKSDDDRMNVRLWNVTSAATTRSFAGPIWFADWVADLVRRNGWLNPKYRLLLTNAPWERSGRPPNAFSVVDLETGQWRRLNVPDHCSATLHRERPWALFLEDAKLWTGYEATVVDLRTGNHLFRWPSEHSPRNGLRLLSAFFVGDGIALSLREPEEKESGPEQFIEWWLLTPELRRASRQTIAVPNVIDATSLTGRLAWRENMHFDECCVYDLACGRMVFDTRKPHPREKGSVFFSYAFRLPTPLLLSSNGSLFFDGSVRDLAIGCVLWSPRAESPETVAGDLSSQWYLRMNDLATASDPRGWFETTETWKLRLGTWNKDATTHGMRSARTGALDFRCYSPVVTAESWFDRAPDVTTDRNWMVSENGVVHQLPPQPNYLLLALCQAILATPLVLLWAVLRWRRKRRVRLVSGIA